MRALNFSILVIGLLFSNVTLSQVKWHVKKSVPILASSANSFAYVAENADGIGGSLYLAKITRTFPVIQAKDIALLENYDSGNYAVGALGTSPDNRYLVSFRSYSYSDDYTDVLEWDSFPHEMEMHFYDMQTGEHLGVIDYSPWGYLNESLLPSQELEAFRHQQIEAGVPPEVVAEYDYSVNNENSAIDFFDLRWNSDGTVSVTFFPEIWVRHTVYESLGSELMTINYAVTPAGVSLESYGDIKTAAAWPSVFDLSVKEPRPGKLQFESWNILFPEQITLFPGLDLTVLLPKKGIMIEGSIPANYWNF